MELSGTTFILELINFVVLMWLLKHFFYQPVREAIEKRRKKIEATLDEAQQQQQEASALKADYESRLNDLEKQYKQRQQTLDKELSDTRDARMAELHNAMAQEKKRLEALNAHQQNEISRAMEKQAANLSLRYVSQLLQGFAGPELEALLINRFIDELEKLPEPRKKHIADSARQGEDKVTVLSAYPFIEANKPVLEKRITDLVSDVELCFQYETSPHVIAGIELLIDSYHIQASLGGELVFFKEILHEG